MKALFNRLHLFLVCAAALAGSLAFGEASQPIPPASEPLISDASVQTGQEVQIRADTTLLGYYSNWHWHKNRFGFLYLMSRDKEEARAALEFNRRFLEDAAQLPVGRIYYDAVLFPVYARLAWMAKVDGDEGEYQRWAEQSVLSLRRLELLRESGGIDSDHGSIKLQEAKAKPFTNEELYDVLHMALALDRNAEVAWVIESAFDFDGFLKTLNGEGL